MRRSTAASFLTPTKPSTAVSMLGEVPPIRITTSLPLSPTQLPRRGYPLVNSAAFARPNSARASNSNKGSRQKQATVEQQIDKRMDPPASSMRSADNLRTVADTGSGLGGGRRCSADSCINAADLRRRSQSAMDMKGRDGTSNKVTAQEGDEEIRVHCTGSLWWATFVDFRALAASSLRRAPTAF